MEEYFNAKNVHELTQQYRNSNIEHELDSIYEKIKLAIQKGEYSVTIDYFGKVIPPGVIQELQNKGFDVREWHDIQRDPCYDIIISW